MSLFLIMRMRGNHNTRAAAGGPRRGLLGAGGETSGVASSRRLPSFGAGGALPTHCGTCARHMDTLPEDRSTERRGGETRLISREAEAVCSLT